MKRTNKIILSVIVVAVLLIGIGYAAIQSVTLNINGSAKASPNQSNFKVKFTGETSVSDGEKVTAHVTNDTNATINVEGLTQQGEVVHAEYTVQNVSTDMSADLEVETTNNNEEYFTIKSQLGKTSLTAGEVTTVTVTVELIQTPEEEVEATVGVQITASPVEPGKEGSTQTPETPEEPEPQKPTLGEVVSNANIGDYIDLGNDALANGLTTNDWRILYVDEQEGKVYAILADYLPNSTNYAANAELDTDETYNVYLSSSKGSRDTFLESLTTEANWEGLANGISGAKVTGAPTWELIVKSYNEKNSAELPMTPTTSQKFESSTNDYDLYVPHTATYENCYSYWLASPYVSSSNVVWFVYFSGVLDASTYSFTKCGVRPVVCLPFNIQVEQKDDVWTVTNVQKPEEPEQPKEPEPDRTGTVVGEAFNVDKYGWKVSGYTATDAAAEAEAGCWRLFYQDETYTYIISDNAINLGTLKNLYTEAGWDTKSGAKIGTIGWKLNLLALQANLFTSTNKNMNILAVGYLTDQDVWKKYKGEGAEYAIGGPSIELYAKSFNATSELNDRKVGTGSQISIKKITPTVTNTYGYKPSVPNSYLQTSYNKGIYLGDKSWWLSSPSFDGANYVILVRNTYSTISSDPPSYFCYYRPVVVIPTSVFNEQYWSTLENV